MVNVVRMMVPLMMTMMMLCVDAETVTSDVLGMMMIAQDPETGHGMTDDELRDQVVTLMLAGHEVSMSAVVTAVSAISSGDSASRNVSCSYGSSVFCVRPSHTAYSTSWPFHRQSLYTLPIAILV